MASKTKVICTIGTTIDSPDVLSRLKSRGVDFFRINLSHTPEEEIESRILKLKEYGVPIILDTEGPQIRSGNTKEVFVKDGSTVKIYNKETECSENSIFLNHPEIINNLSVGDLIYLDFNSVLLKVSDISQLSQGYIKSIVLMEGIIGGRKGVHIDTEFSLPAFSQKDLRAVEIAKKYRIKTFTLSFIKSHKDVEKFKSIYSEAIIYSKIECKDALKDLRAIIDVSNGILIDRGDLSRDISVESVPFVQKQIIKLARSLGKEVFVATNTLENMSFSLKPNKAEVNDIVNILLDGATGIALTKETAIGKYPVETVNMLYALIKNVEFIKNKELDAGGIDPISYIEEICSEKSPDLLVKPHGGILVNRIADKNVDIKLPEKKLFIDERTLMDIEQIAVGSFSPLTGFLCSNDFYSVLDNMKLENGIVWPLPIILQTTEEIAKNIKNENQVSLAYSQDGNIYAILDIKEIYKINLNECAKKIYGTDSQEHPGVKRFFEKGDYLIGGDITLLKRRDSEYKLYELKPRQTRKIFSERGWSKIIGFHTRNVIHRSHEFVQLEGLKKSGCDGLFVHPVIGMKKPGDFDVNAIVKSYEIMADKIYPKSKVIFSTLATYSRYAGPREAIFTALIRKNFGCSHFIVGRDHTGVGNFYDPKASHNIFDKFTYEELGIIPVKFDNIFYSSLENKHIHELDASNHPEDKKLQISGTKIREMFKSGQKPPEWFMRPEISEMILERIKNNLPVFVE